MLYLFLCIPISIYTHIKLGSGFNYYQISFFVPEKHIKLTYKAVHWGSLLGNAPLHVYNRYVLEGKHCKNMFSWDIMANSSLKDYASSILVYFLPTSIINIIFQRLLLY